ncbi:hypothetical protein SAMN04487990_1315 [Bizionia paragorgiae]|uniref:Uncharacterized protein n=1 Tax=Bizionia paragorgiae TaxID=283786 RepID=A0A1H4DFE2_BIZPA|nr:hypothetical protein SAMN04487990_1315 [Bizionia paragorgiae]
MKLNKTNLFLLIWVLHLFVYYLIFMCLYKIANNDYNEFYTVLFGFIGGLIGWPIKQLPLFFIIPSLLMLILIKIKFQKKWFLAYVMSICLAYLTNYFWLFFNFQNDIMLGYPKTNNTIIFIIPSLIVSIVFNWLIFRKTYKKLGL